MKTRVSKAIDILKRIFINNAMFDETLRFRRKFLRVEGNLAKIGVFFVVVFYLCILFMFFNNHINASSFIVYLELTVVVFTLPLSIYGAISEEKEKGTWEALILTRLSSAQIVAGKALWRVGLLLLIMTLHYFAGIASILGERYSNVYVVDPLFYYRLSEDFGRLTYAQAPIFTFGLLLITFGLTISSRTNKSITSLGVIIVIMLFILAFMPMIASIIFSGAGSGEAVFMNCYNPYFLIAEILNNSSSNDKDILTVEIVKYMCFAYLWLSIGFTYLSYSNLVKMSVPFIRLKKHAKN